MHDLDDFNITDASRGAAFTVRVVSSAAEQAVGGIMEDMTVIIHLTSQSGDGQENDELVGYLSGLFDIDPGNIEIVAGLSKDRKLISVLHISAEDVDTIFRSNMIDD